MKFGGDMCALVLEKLERDCRSACSLAAYTCMDFSKNTFNIQHCSN